MKKIIDLFLRWMRYVSCKYQIRIVCVPGLFVKNNFDSNYALQRAVEIINSEDYTIDCLLITEIW